MLNHVMATEAFPPHSTRKSIFLAGPTPRDEHTASWRPEALDFLTKAGFDGIVYDPERRAGWTDNYDDQIAWEAEGLTRASVIVFWIPRDLDTLPGFTTNVEFGEWYRSGKVVLGSPPDAPKMRYLIAKAADAGIHHHTQLRDTLVAAIAKMPI